VNADNRRRVRLLSLLLLAPVLLLLLAWPVLAPTDPDYWAHFTTGRIIAETGALPSQDVYLYTTNGQPWVVHEWLTELTFFVVQRQVGYVGDVVLVGVVGCLTALAMYATCRLWGLGELPSVVLVLWAFGMSLPSFGVRPQTLTRCLLAVTALLLTAHRLRGNRRLLWPLPPLFALWANLHGGFIIGLGVLGLTVLGDAVDAFRTRSLVALKPLLTVAALCALATLINLNGLAGVLFPLAYAQPGFVGQSVIAEWQPPDFSQLSFAPFGLSILLALALGFGHRPLRTTELLWALSLGWLGLESIRNIQLWATIAVPLIGARLRAEVPAFGRSAAEWARPVRMAVLWSLVVVVSVGLLGVRVTQSANWELQLGREPSAAGYPVSGVAYIKDHDLRGNLFNQFEWGGYLIYALYPHQRLFIDGRPDVYGPGILQEYLTVAELRPGWRMVLDKYSVQLVLVDRSGPLAGELGQDPGWRQVLSGPIERLFERS
jgi:hypothetical protein